ncbi:ATP-binding protein [Acidobacteriota bacterium]
MQNRPPYLDIWKNLSKDKSMIFLSGPRQSGKTTLAHLIARSFKNSLYFNWDIAEDRTLFFQDPVFFEKMERKDPTTPLVILDEIHKYKDWKNYLKGVYDRFHDQYQFLVSGSGRLDLYQKGGDSLAGRYFLFHLLPFTLAELAGQKANFDRFVKDPLLVVTGNTGNLKNTWANLSKFSGFPEPYLKGSETFYRRWSNTYSRQLIREDVRDLTGIRSIGEVETLYYLLPSKVGSTLSMPSLARDLQVSYNSVQNWLRIFERFFLVFSISPWSIKISRAIRKERKVYLWDIPRITDPASRFENMIASELWRAVTGWNHMGFGSFTLHFIRDKEKREVDFLIADRNEPLLLIEAKQSEIRPSSELRRFQSVLGIPAVQLTNEGEGYRLFSSQGHKILVTPAFLWLPLLPFH